MPYTDDFNDAAFERAWGRDEPIDSRNEDEIIAARLDAKNNIREMMSNAHPDSILGCMAKMKASLNKFNSEKDE